MIVKVEASDEDDVLGTEKLTYKLHKGDPQSFFRVDQNSGYVTTSGMKIKICANFELILIPKLIIKLEQF